MRARCWLVPLAAFAAIGAVRAHELGAVQIRARFDRASRFEIRIDVDPSRLPPKLRSSALGSPEERRRFVDDLEGGFSPRFDMEAADAKPVWTPSDTGGAPGGIVVVASGVVPRGARAFDIGVGLSAGASYFACVSPAGVEQAQWVAPGSRSLPCAIGGAAPAEAGAVAGQYLALGFSHIVPWGADHILFVLGLFLMARGLRPLLTQVTAFTLAHSVSLGFAAAGLVSIPSRLVEPAIAVSIVVIAVENVFSRRVSGSRTLLVFAFGLLHGLGFAGALRELGLPQDRFFVALFSFNAGVEVGQLFVILSAFALVGWWTKRRTWYRRWVVVPASASIAATGLFWAIERLLA
jgi:HupE/UreJ protein